MKRFRPVLLFVVILLVLGCFAPAALAADYYEDEESGIRFEIPEGWEQDEIDADRELLNCMFTKDLHFFGFAYGDMWNMVPPEERFGYTRAEIDNSIFSEQDIWDMYGNGEVTTAYYGDFEYYVWRGDFAADYQGIDMALDSIVAIRVSDVNMYQFQCQAFALDDAYMKEFEQMLGSVEYSGEAAAPVMAGDTEGPDASYAAVQETYAAPHETFSYAASSYDTALPTAGGIILSLILTVAIYSLPIIIYRYGIRKRPMEKKAAVKVTAIYGICAFFVIMLLLYALAGDGKAGGAVILWSFINYHMLTRGEDRTAEGERNRVSGTAGQPGATGSGWYPAGGSANPYASALQPHNNAPNSNAQAANPYAAASQANNSTLGSGTWPVTRSDMEKRKASKYASAPQPQNGAPNSGSGQAAQGNPYADASQPQGTQPPIRQDKDKYDRGDSRKSKRGEESGRSRGHAPHKYWRGE